MASFNRVILLGNVTRDLETRYTPSGTAVLDLGLAVNDRKKMADGSWGEEVTFVDVTLWGRTAEVAAEYLSKGSPVLIEGRLKFDTWENKEGEKRSKLKVVGERMQLIGSRGGGGAGGGGPSSGSQQNSEYSQAAPPAQDSGCNDGPPPSQAGGDDIPF